MILYGEVSLEDGGPLLPRFLERDDVFAYLQEMRGASVSVPAVSYGRLYDALRRVAEVFIAAVDEAVDGSQVAGDVVERFVDDVLPYLEGVEESVRPYAF